MTIEIVREEIAPSEYARIINAAVHMSRSKFDLAEALILDIPPVKGGSGEVQAALEQVAQDIVDAGGDEIAWRVLRNMRMTALWVNRNPKMTDFAWREGSSFDAHLRAAAGGMDYDLFAKQQRTSREVREMLGHKVDGTVTSAVDTMTDTDKAELITALVNDDDEAVGNAVQAKRKDGYVTTVCPPPEGNTPAPSTPSESDQNIQRIAMLKEVIGGAVKWTDGILAKWDRGLFIVKGVMNEGDREVIAGYYLEIAKLYTDAANKLKDN